MVVLTLFEGFKCYVLDVGDNDDLTWSVFQGLYRSAAITMTSLG